MRKRVIAAALAAAAVLGGAAMMVSGGLTAGDSLVSLGYLTDTYQAELDGRVTGEIGDKLKADYDAAVGELDRARAQQTGADTDGWLYAKTFQPAYYKALDALAFSQGSGFLLLAGTAQLGADSGALVDVTAGAEVSAGGVLTAGRRYLAGGETAAAVTVLSGSAQLAPVGYYTQTLSEQEAMPFADVLANAWYYDSVRFSYFAGLFNGVSETEFGPASSMTRAMLAAVLCRLAGSPAQSAPERSAFSDVAQGAWYYSYVCWAASAGIVNGMGDSSFAPGSNITREQMAVMLFRYAGGYLGLTCAERGELSGFSDAEHVSAWADDALRWAVGTGIVTGRSDGALDPTGTASRAEVATMLRRFSELVQ